MESEYFYPVINELGSEEAERIVDRFEARSFEDYTPMIRDD